MSYSMPLSELLTLFSLDLSEQNATIDIASLAIDSREVTLGSLFFAYPGAKSDGRDYMLSAQEAGASAIVYEAGIELPKEVTIPAFAVSGLQQTVGYIADKFYKQPSLELQVFGVTGTNGKTTNCYLLTQALELLGMDAVMIGTIGVGRLSALASSGHTTPDPISVQRLLASFRDQGVTQVCMEVSSHALDQGRVNGVQFFSTLFTNLTHDHLDYHKDMSQYAAAKRLLFTKFHSELVITNADDEMGAGLVDVANAEFIVSYGQGGDVYADEVDLTNSGMHLFIEGNGIDFELSTPLIGRINVANIEMLVATLLALSTPVEEIQNILAQLKPAPGRMELFTAPNKPQVVVDYAHTPDALEKALLSIKAHCDGQLWCVFGCGGDRDKDKRPLMGRVAGDSADRILITNDNPRSESPEQIVKEIVAGIEKEVQVELDRKQAILLSIKNASSKDWVLVAGKGHETSQQIGDQILPFCDRELVAQVVSE